MQIWGDEKRPQVLCEIGNRVAASSVRGEIMETAAQHHPQGLVGACGRGEEGAAGGVQGEGSLQPGLHFQCRLTAVGQQVGETRDRQ